ncbi:thiol-disulfide oxidoreductase DCC family protein [Paenibacillus segetis]|uniref:Thiol-disulfide oxidoreductase DCC family protein n=1 Tax=Paenibacillus segetis TaxID=1325360 RepID=A0ABQ1Y593_9BACL|nr:DCC1-like thiol-disulfide oxidoreductase family protein [Paenibacillus segetis]GGH13190.1 hypothetical protein GCM10008013_06090 [Paenibacillus segetis]
MNIDHSEPDAIVLFDGVCHLCQGAVKFIIKRDPKGRFHYASLQSPAGRRLMAENGVNAELLDTIVLFDKNNYYIRSTAALHIAKRLTFPWPLLYGFIVIPRFIRDAIYRVIAANRYRLFGRDETCLVPTKELRSRFLEDGQHLT